MLVIFKQYHSLCSFVHHCSVAFLPSVCRSVFCVTKVAWIMKLLLWITEQTHSDNTHVIEIRHILDYLKQIELNYPNDWKNAITFKCIKLLYFCIDTIFPFNSVKQLRHYINEVESIWNVESHDMELLSLHSEFM